MPKKNGQRDTQKTAQGYEIPVPKREDVFGLLGKAAKKHPKTPQRKVRKSREK